MASSTDVARFIFKPVTSLLSIIIKSAKEIREVVKRVKANEHQCLRLSERIIIIVGFLEGKQLGDELSEPLRKALVYFAIFLQKCLEFMNTFANADWLKLFWNNKDYSHRLTDLQTEFSQYETGLNFGIQLENTLVDKNQNERVGGNSSSIAVALPLTITNHEVVDRKDRQQTIFKSGIWIYSRCLNEKWHNPFHCELSFDRNTKTLRGSGKDNLGRFKLDGTFDEQIRAIEMTWSYKDHVQIVQLQWDNDRHVLCGISLEKKKATDQVCRCMGQFQMNLFTPVL